MITVYVLTGKKRYIGITNNLERRLDEHRIKSSKGSQVIGEFKLLYTEEYPDYASARKREKYLKSGRGRKWLDHLEKSQSPPSAKADKSAKKNGG
ncbi:MAG: GIY-YIG nuclease family protein [Candidatus Cloacimonetes bacterium]|nr:GIY-YIG nuclease family protein [Candidatus Cloacimonadota bacterium]